jgi:hypothetical protein
MKTKGKAILRFFFETFWGPVIVWWAKTLFSRRWGRAAGQLAA